MSEQPTDANTRPEGDTGGDEGTAQWSDYRRVAVYIAPYWRRLALILLISLLSIALSLVQPYLAKFLIDDALLARDLNALLLVAMLMVGVTVVGFVFSFISGYTYVKISAEALFDMRLALFRHLQKLSPRFFARRKLGDILSRLNNDIAEIQRVSADSVLSLLSSVLFFFGSVVIMFWLDWRLSLVGLSMLPFSLWSLRHYQGRLTQRVRRLREHGSEIGSFLIESIMGMRLVVSSGAEEREVERFRGRNLKFIDALLSMQIASRLAGALPGMLLALSTAVVFLYGGRRVIDGAITVGALVAFLAYHLRLLAPIQSLFGLYTGLATARVSLRRVLELFDEEIEVTESPAAVTLQDVRGEIEFEDVSFEHDRGDAVLGGVSFHIPAGSTCAVIGPSGVGKSTVADLIIRLYDPKSGRVSLDGRDLRELSLASLRAAVALVDQTPYLLNATIRDNLIFAQPDASEEAITDAARQASVHEFIAGLPEGYETEVGERGLALSAGEKQRICLARALLRRPAVLVLDEPTAALDPETEIAICETLAQILRGRTAVIITHSPRLIEIADQVVVLKEGRVAWTGRPDELGVSGAPSPQTSALPSGVPPASPSDESSASPSGPRPDALAGGLP